MIFDSATGKYFVKIISANQKDMKKTTALLTLAILPIAMNAQQVLSLQECRDRAVNSSKELDQARVEVEMASYDKKIARANYFPEISATGAYMYNDRDISLISDAQSEKLGQAGGMVQYALNKTASDFSKTLQAAFPEKNPALFNFEMPYIAGLVNNICEDIDNALHPDLHNIWMGGVSLRQPVFVGGKIIYSNQMAVLAEELAESKFDQKYADIIVDVDQAYWQIVSIANKRKLAESYSALLNKMKEDVEKSVEAGVATESDLLKIKVKANESNMLLTKSTNGLELAKMLLCKRIGLPLDSEIMLADEELEIIPQPQDVSFKSMEEIFSDRPETRSLSLASEIYDRKSKIARADMLPKVALTANYLLTNPNAYNGFQNTWNGGMLSAGVMVSMPIFHGFEATAKYKKARAEARLYDDKDDDAKDLITLQVTRQRKLLDEAREKLGMCESNLDSAEENLRQATVGFEAGVASTDTVLGAQTAWLSAHSDYIDAGIELQMAYANLQKAEGNYKGQNNE